MRKSSASTAVPADAITWSIAAFCSRSLVTQAPPCTSTIDGKFVTPHGRYKRASSDVSPTLPYSRSSTSTSCFCAGSVFVAILMSPPRELLLLRRCGRRIKAPRQNPPAEERCIRRRRKLGRPAGQFFQRIGVHHDAAPGAIDALQRLPPLAPHTGTA